MRFEAWAMICLVIVMTCFSVWLWYNASIVSGNECLKDIATELCDEYGLVYNIKWNGLVGAGFSCKGDPHQYETEKYRFTDEEVESCLG